MYFQWHIELSRTVHEEDMVLESYYEKERPNMVVFNDSPNLYFYFHLPVIFDLEVLTPFTLFQA